MKKIAFLIGILMATLTAGVASASLYDYYSEQGLNLPSVEKRMAIATQCGISGYKGLKSQNIALEACLRGKSDMLGATPTPTSSANRKYVETPDFFLYSPAVSGDTSITINDLEDIYGNTLTMSDFGSLNYGRIDPDGASVSESFTFTGISANTDGTYTLTGVKSVLAKYPYTQTSGLARSHSINAIVRFTNTAAFYDSFANKDNNEIVEGQWTYNQFPKFNTSTQIPTTDGQFATKYYVDQVGAGGFTAANVSTTRGLSVDGSIPEKVGINASSTTGMSFDSNGKLYQKLQTNGGILTTSTGLYITTTSLNNAGVVSTTASAGLIAQASSTGRLDDGWQNITYANASTLTNSSNADALHIHNYYKKLFVTSTAISVSNTTTETIIASTTVAGGTLNSNNVIKFTIPISAFTSVNNSGYSITTTLYYGGVSVCSFLIAPGIGGIPNSQTGYLTGFIMGNNTSTSQFGLMSIFTSQSSGGLNNAIVVNAQCNGTSSIDSSISKSLYLTSKWNSTNAANSITYSGAIFDIIR